MTRVPDNQILDNGTNIKVHFDRPTNKHRIDVTFSVSVARRLAADGKLQCATEDDIETGGCQTDEVRDEEENGGSELVGKKSRGSGEVSAADHAYSVTVE